MLLDATHRTGVIAALRILCGKGRLVGYTFQDHTGAGPAADLASLGSTRSAQTLTFWRRTPTYWHRIILPGELSQRPVDYATDDDGDEWFLSVNDSNY